MQALRVSATEPSPWVPTFVGMTVGGALNVSLAEPRVRVAGGGGRMRREPYKPPRIPIVSRIGGPMLG